MDDAITMSKDALFEMLVAAYTRGGVWMSHNADLEYLNKAASDYADVVTSQLERIRPG